MFSSFVRTRSTVWVLMASLVWIGLAMPAMGATLFTGDYDASKWFQLGPVDTSGAPDHITLTDHPGGGWSGMQITTPPTSGTVSFYWVASFNVDPFDTSGTAGYYYGFNVPIDYQVLHNLFDFGLTPPTGLGSFSVTAGDSFGFWVDGGPLNDLSYSIYNFDFVASESEVPEPSTFVLIGSVALFAAFRARRKTLLQAPARLHTRATLVRSLVRTRRTAGWILAGLCLASLTLAAPAHAATFFTGPYDVSNWTAMGLVDTSFAPDHVTLRTDGIFANIPIPPIPLSMVHDRFAITVPETGTISFYWVASVTAADPELRGLGQATIVSGGSTSNNTLFRNFELGTPPTPPTGLASFSVTAGDLFRFAVTADSGAVMELSIYNFDGPVASGGEVPEPSTVVLIGSVAVLAAFRARRRAFAGIAARAVLCLGAASAGLHAAGVYILTDLGTLGGTNSVALGINNLGQVVGQSDTGNPISSIEAFLYSGGPMVGLGAGAGSDSSARGINDAGQIVGNFLPQIADGRHGFLLSGGSWLDLGTLGGTISSASAINAGGAVVGTSRLGDESDRAYLINGGPMTSLGTLASGTSIATGINGSGQVVGSSHALSGDRHAYLYSGGSMADLGTLGGSTSQAQDINNSGQVVGRSDITGDTSVHPFLYSAGVMLDLGTLGGSSGTANGINNFGQVVGQSSTGSATHAFLYTGGAMVDLSELMPIAHRSRPLTSPMRSMTSAKS